MSDTPPEGGLVLPPLRRRLVGGTAWAATGRLVVAVTALGTNALAARLLDPADAGTFFLAQSAIIFGALFAQNGLQRVATRFVAQSLAEGNAARARAAIRTVLRSGWTIALALAVVMALPPVARAVGRVFSGTRIGDVLWIVGVILVMRALTILRAEAFRGFQDMARATIFGGLDAGILTVVLLAAVWAFAPSLATLSVVLGITAVAWLPDLAMSSVALRRRVGTLATTARVSYGEVFTVAWPVFLASMGGFLMAQADLWVVGARLAGPEVAVYGAALRLTMVVTIPLQISNLVVPPIIAELYTKGADARLQRVLRTMATVAGIPSAAVLAAFVVAGGPIMRFVYGSFYERGGTVLAILSAGAIVAVWTGSCGFALTMTRYERTNMVIALFGGVALVVTALTVVDRFGIVAVAVASAVVQAATNLAAWVAARKLLGVYTHAGVSPALSILAALRSGRSLRERLLGER